MNSAAANPLTFKFHSTSHRYKGVDEPDLCLEVYRYGSDALEVKIINRNFSKQKLSIRTIALFCTLSCCIYLWLIFNLFDRLVYAEIFLVLWVSLILWRSFSLVESEKFIFCNDFGFHLQTTRLLGKSNTFIASSKIHDVRINEVIENLDFRYILIIRTRGELFLKKPIIAVFKIFKPTFECLSIVYKHLNEVMPKNKAAVNKQG